MSATKCPFDLIRCAPCLMFADCLDEAMPLLLAEPEPRTDGPLKLRGPRVGSHRFHRKEATRHE